MASAGLCAPVSVVVGLVGMDEQFYRRDQLRSQGSGYVARPCGKDGH